MTFDEGLLADEAELSRRDADRLLWSLAGSGAQVRNAVQLADEFGAGALATSTPPRAVLLSGDDAARDAFRVLARVIAPSAAVVEWTSADLPRWAGPSDALLVAAVDGAHPRTAALLAQAGRRGLLCAAVAPGSSPIAAAAGRSPFAALAPDVRPRAARWALLTPLLLAAHELGVCAVALGLFAEVADALDAAAEACRPSAEVFTNPAKMLATDLAESRPVVAGAGSFATIAARIFADDLRRWAGLPAIAVGLPDELALASALLARSAGPADDFFRDRIDEADRGARLVTIGDDGDPRDPVFGERSAGEIELEEIAARRALDRLVDSARISGGPPLRVDVPSGSRLVRLARATAIGAFTAAYAALGLGRDLSDSLARDVR